MNLLSDDIDFLMFAGQAEKQFIRSTDYFADQLKDRFKNGYQITGMRLPWSSTWDKFRFRESEVTLHMGYNGHGKSNILGQMLSWMPRDTKILIASMEMTPTQTLHRMARQAVGNKMPTDEFIDYFIRETDNIYIYDQNDSVHPDRIRGMVHYAARELGVKVIMIDSLMKCGIKPDDFNMQKDFTDRLCWAAKNEGVHIHLVHHSRKPLNELSPPGKYDSKGAGEIVDLVDNVLVHFRRKEKEEAREDAKDNGLPFDEAGEPDQMLYVQKQRHFEWEGGIGLWFDPHSTQYVMQDGCNLPWRGFN